MDINRLVNDILKFKQHYYYGTPMVSDAVYDSLEDQLRKLDPDNPVLKMVGSPVMMDGVLEEAVHDFPMTSLNKVNSYDEFVKWFNKYNSKVVMMFKMDGSSIELKYRNGRFVQAITRGDGIKGEDVTFNVSRFKNVPLFVDGLNGSIRGEAMLLDDDWTIVDPDRATNPRNVGNGIVQRKDGTQSEHITFFAFDASVSVNGNQIEADEDKKIDFLSSVGFKTVSYFVFDNPTDCLNYFNSVATTRRNNGFAIDGMVVKVINPLLHDGLSNNRPKYQIAWKFESEHADTVMNDIVVSFGHDGPIIPNGRLEPVLLDGTVVSNVLLNNWDEIDRLQLAIGDTVRIIKSNDIIPKVISVINRPSNRVVFSEPTHCPACGTKTVRNRTIDKSEGAITLCPNPECDAKVPKKLNKWIKDLDIKGIGDSILEAMIENGIVNSPCDLYLLTVESIENLIISSDGSKGIKLGNKRAKSIIDEINSKKVITIPQLLGSIGIQYLGQRRVEIIQELSNGQFDRIEDWFGNKLIDLADVISMPNTAKIVQNKLNASKSIVDKLISAGVTIRSNDTKVNVSSSAMRICITGSLPSGRTKNDINSIILSKGHVQVDKVSKDTNYLVVSDSSKKSEKIDKAVKYNVKMISEQELYTILGVEQ